MPRSILIWIVAGLLTLLASAPVHAGNCPPLIQLVEDTLEISDALGLDDATVADIEALRDEAEAKHEAGDDRACVETIDSALALLEPEE